MSKQRIPTVKEAMTPFPHQIEVGQGTEGARRMMVEHRIKHLPVRDGSKLLGIVTDRDLDVALTVLGGAGREGEALLRELCKEAPHVVDLHEPLDQVVLHMAEKKLAAVLVFRDDRLAGILTVSDVCRMYGELLRELAPPEDEPA
jgi:acetoin utilization protein AcuB